MAKRNIIIIPARKGSKRFPGKNMSLLNGIPLISHSFNYAKDNREIGDRIIVSTNDNLVRDLAFSAGLEVILRPEELCEDTSSTVTALMHVIENVGTSYDNVILLQPTNPLRPASLLQNAYEEYISGKFESLMTVSSIKKKIGKIFSNNYIPFNYEIGQRSQDLEPLFFENGLLYIIKVHLIKQGKILSKNNCPFLVDHPFANIDIDYKEDLELAQFYLNQEKRRN